LFHREPARRPGLARVPADGDAYKFLFMAKGGGSANKSYLYQETKAVLNPTRMAAFLEEKIRTIGTSACPPYHGDRGRRDQRGVRAEDGQVRTAAVLRHPVDIRVRTRLMTFRCQADGHRTPQKSNTAPKAALSHEYVDQLPIPDLVGTVLRSIPS
jgi:Fumarate hydratase (Fumerase)